MRHKVQQDILWTTLDDAWANRSDVFVGANMGVYFSETQALKNDFRAPDVFVVLDTTKHERKRWVVWEEDGQTPDVVIELLSESTEEVDRGIKKRIYARMLHVPVYVLYDPFSAAFEAYRLNASREYEPIAPDARGRIHVEPLQLWLGIVPGVHRDIEAPWLRWFDEEGTMLPLPGERAAYHAQRARLEAERAARETERAEREARRAEREAERANAAEAELAKLREELKRRG